MKNVFSRSLSLLVLSASTFGFASFGFAAQHVKKHAMTVAKGDSCAVVCNKDTHEAFKHGEEGFKTHASKGKPAAPWMCYASVEAAKTAGCNVK